MIDREYPEERIEYILKKSKSRFVITDKPSRKSSAQGGSAKILYKLLMAEKSVELKVFDITQKEELEKYSTDPQKHKGIFFQAEDGIRDWSVTGVQTCALPI